MVRSITEIQSNTDRLMGEIRSMMVDLCLRSGITEINGRRLSREDSHIFFYQKDEIDSARLCSLNAMGKVEGNTNGSEGINFEPKEPEIPDTTSPHSKSAFNSHEKLDYKEYQSYNGNLCKDVEIDELKGLGGNEKVDLGQSVTEVHELKVFDEMPSSNAGENEMLQLSKNVPENASQVFDKKTEGNSVGNRLEFCCDKVILDEHENVGKTQHTSEVGGADHGLNPEAPAYVLSHDHYLVSRVPAFVLGHDHDFDPQVPKLVLSNEHDLDTGSKKQHELVRKTIDEAWVIEFVKEGTRFKVIDISSTIASVQKACLEFYETNSFLDEWSELERPPPEPPPQQPVAHSTLGP